MTRESRDNMCSIMSDLYIKVDEYTDSALVYKVTHEQLVSLYDLGRSAEREACKVTCQSVIDSGDFDGWQQYAAAACRDAISARGNK